MDGYQRSHGHADDLIQEAALALLEATPDANESYLGIRARGAMRSAQARFMRPRRHETQLQPAIAAVAASPDETDRLCLQKNARRVIENCMRNLTPIEAKAMRMEYLLGEKRGATAAALGVTVSAVGKILLRAQAKMVKLLSTRYGVGRSDHLV